MSKVVKIVIGILAGAGLTMAVLGLFTESRSERYERGYNQIRIGDSKRSVVDVMGEPDERSWCYPLRTDNDIPERKRFHEQCVEHYHYITFLKPYNITFDKDDRVSDKGYMISP
jgi:hypothetical protein